MAKAQGSEGVTEFRGVKIVTPMRQLAGHTIMSAKLGSLGIPVSCCACGKRTSAIASIEMTRVVLHATSVAMSRLVFILGAPNSKDGRLSPVSLKRIEAAIAKQRDDPSVVILATGGFGAHFNTTDTPHREFVYQQLEAAGATIDRGERDDLLSSNTVEDIALIVAFTKTRSADDYTIITSRFHADRCRFIVDCLAAKQVVAVLSADDPEDLPDEARDHEERSLHALSAQGGVILGNVLHPHPGVTGR